MVVMENEQNEQGHMSLAHQDQSLDLQTVSAAQTIPGLCVCVKLFIETTRCRVQYTHSGLHSF